MITGKTSTVAKPPRSLPSSLCYYTIFGQLTLSVREFWHRQEQPAGAEDRIGIHLGIGSIATSEQTSFKQILPREY